MEPRVVNPYGLSLLATLAVLAGTLLVIAGLALVSGLGTGSEGPELYGIVITAYLGYLEILIVTQQSTWSGVVLLILSSIYYATAIGLFLDKRWAWPLSIGLSVLGTVSSVVQMVLSPIGLAGWLALALSIAALFYLTRPRVRGFFDRDPRIVATENSRSARPAADSA